MFVTNSGSLLEQIFDNLPAGVFVRAYYPVRGWFAHGDLARFGDFAESADWDDTASLINSSSQDELIGYTRSGDGRPLQAWFPKSGALAAYETGVTLELSTSGNPAIRILCSRLADALGLGSGRVRADVFVSPRGEAVPKHFDAIDVLVLQLRGRKRWQIAPNLGVRFPRDAFIPGFGRDIRNPRAGSAEPAGPGPTLEMPEDSQTIEMVPGSAMFVPRGWWHRTCADSASVSLSILIRPLTTGEGLRNLVEQRILTRSEWRQPVSSAGAAAEVSLRERLAGLLEGLRSETSSLSAKDFHATAIRNRRYKRRAGVTVTLTAQDDGSSTVVVVDLSGLTVINTMVPDYAAKLFAWVAKAREDFSLADLLPLFPPGCTDWIELMLSILEERNVIEPVGS